MTIFIHVSCNNILTTQHIHPSVTFTRNINVRLNMCMWPFLPSNVCLLVSQRSHCPQSSVQGCWKVAASGTLLRKIKNIPLHSSAWACYDMCYDNVWSRPQIFSCVVRCFVVFSMRGMCFAWELSLTIMLYPSSIKFLITQCLYHFHDKHYYYFS